MVTHTQRIKIPNTFIDTPEKTRAFIRLFGDGQYKKALVQWAEQKHHSKADPYPEEVLAKMSDDEYQAAMKEIHENESKLNNQAVFAEVVYSPMNAKEVFGHQWNDVQEIFGNAEEGTAAHRIAMELAGLGGLDVPDTAAFQQILGKKPPIETVITDILAEREALGKFNEKA